jgi:hypothetical protein
MSKALVFTEKATFGQDSTEVRVTLRYCGAAVFENEHAAGAFGIPAAQATRLESGDCALPVRSNPSRCSTT